VSPARDILLRQGERANNFGMHLACSLSVLGLKEQWNVNDLRPMFRTFSQFLQVKPKAFLSSSLSSLLNIESKQSSDR
jgi:hypothetical protein